MKKNLKSYNNFIASPLQFEDNKAHHKCDTKPIEKALEIKQQNLWNTINKVVKIWQIDAKVKVEELCKQSKSQLQVVVKQEAFFVYRY